MLADGKMPPQSADGMGGWEVSTRAQAASCATLLQSVHPSLALDGLSVARWSKRYRSGCLYAGGFVLAAVAFIYVFALSN
jgi:hypothetical protein